jgi:hypothetical protein
MSSTEIVRKVVLSTKARRLVCYTGTLNRYSVPKTPMKMLCTWKRRRRKTDNSSYTVVAYP